MTWYCQTAQLRCPAWEAIACTLRSECASGNRVLDWLLVGVKIFRVTSSLRCTPLAWRLEESLIFRVLPSVTGWYMRTTANDTGFIAPHENDRAKWPYRRRICRLNGWQ